MCAPARRDRAAVARIARSCASIRLDVALMERLMMGPIFASCEETRDRLSDQLEGELVGLRAWRVARHLGHCMRCSAMLRSLGRTVEHLHALARTDMAPPPAATVVDSVLQQIAHNER